MKNIAGDREISIGRDELFPMQGHQVLMKFVRIFAEEGFERIHDLAGTAKVKVQPNTILHGAHELHARLKNPFRAESECNDFFFQGGGQPFVAGNDDFPSVGKYVHDGKLKPIFKIALIYLLNTRTL
jgi:hypothetical protein